MNNSNSKEEVPVFVPEQKTTTALETKVKSEKAKTMVTVGIFLLAAIWFGYNGNLLTVPMSAIGVLVYLMKSNYSL